LVLQRKIRAAVEAPSVGEAEDVDAVVRRDDDVALRAMDPVCRKLGWDIDAACVVAAAGPVEQDGQFRIGCGVRGRPDGER